MDSLFLLLLLSSASSQYIYNSKTSYGDHTATLTKDEADGLYTWDRPKTSGSPNGPTAITGCTPIHTSWLLRHGSRNGDDDEETAATGVLRRMRLAGVNVTKLGFADYKLPYNESNYDMLNTAGTKENRRLGELVGQAYASLFASGDAANIKFYASSKNRTLDSAKAFKRGLNYSQDSDVEVRNNITYFYKECDKHENADEDEVLKVFNKFKASSTVQEVLDRFKERVCHNCNFSVEFDEIDELISLCGIEHGLSIDSPWCKLFTEQDLRVFEYLADLETYYDAFYGGMLPDAACVVVKDIIDTAERSMESRVSGIRSGGELGVFRFTHRSGITSVLGALGLFHDHAEKFSESSFQQRRKFRTTVVTPMGSNLEVLLSDCDPGAPAAELLDRARVHVRVNGRPVAVPACGGEDTCLFKDFASYIRRQPHYCDFNKICSLNSSTSLRANYFSTVLASLLLVLQCCSYRRS